MLIPGHSSIDVRSIHWIEYPDTTQDSLNPFYMSRKGGLKDKKRRLVTTGLSGQVVEWCLQTGKVKQSLSSPGGPIWNSKADGKFVYLAC